VRLRRPFGTNVDRTGLFLALLVAALVPAVAFGGDQNAPQSPAPVTIGSVSGTSVAISWGAPHGRVAGYDVYSNGAKLGGTTLTSYTFSSLTCGSTYMVGVDAFDWHGNTSAVASVAATTQACPPALPPPSPPPATAADTQPPTTPGQLVAIPTTTSLTPSWHPSTDNVGVAGYDVFQDGVKLGATTTSSYTSANLTCGTGYTIGVDAYDAAGNRSALVTTTTATSSCPVSAGSSAATVYVSSQGNDANACTQAAPCATFDRARKVAPPGGTVVVAGGTFSANWAAAGAAVIYPDSAHDASGTAPVTFVCQGNGDVTFDKTAPNFTFYPGVANVAFTGACFHFHILHFGYGGYADAAHDIVISGVKLDSFECAGCANVTIRGSEIGPVVGCYGTAQSVPTAEMCDPAKAGETYWASLPLGSSNQAYTPYIHRGAAGPASNVTLDGDYFHDIQTRDSSGMHTECLQLWGVNGFTLRNSRFYHCAIFDVFASSDDVENNFTIENNFFSAPVEPLNASNAGVETPLAWRELVVKSFPGTTISNWLIRFNSFEHGISLDNSAVGQTYSNARVIGNVLGSYSYCVAGVAWDYNATVNQGMPCDAHVTNLSSFPYVGYATGDLHLLNGSAAMNAVLPTAADYAIASDIDFQARPMGSARDIGADESG
jgi:hypothetical protein